MYSSYIAILDACCGYWGSSEPIVDDSITLYCLSERCIIIQWHLSTRKFTLGT